MPLTGVQTWPVPWTYVKLCRSGQSGTAGLRTIMECIAALKPFLSHEGFFIDEIEVVYYSGQK